MVDKLSQSSGLIRTLGLLRIRLRSLLLFFIVVCVVLGCLTYNANRISRARRSLSKLGGTLEFAHQFDEKGYVPGSSSQSGSFAERIQDFYVTPWHVNLWGTKVTDADLVLLNDVQHIRVLSAGLTDITDEGTITISRMAHLTSLGLEATLITDVGVANLSKLTNLTDFDLGSTLITDNSLDHLRKLTSLRQLNITGTRFTAGAVQELQLSLPQCKIDF